MHAERSETRKAADVVKQAADLIVELRDEVLSLRSLHREALDELEVWQRRAHATQCDTCDGFGKQNAKPFADDCEDCRGTGFGWA